MSRFMKMALNSRVVIKSIRRTPQSKAFFGSSGSEARMKVGAGKVIPSDKEAGLTKYQPTLGLQRVTGFREGEARQRQRIERINLRSAQKQSMINDIKARQETDAERVNRIQSNIENEKRQLGLSKRQPLTPYQAPANFSPVNQYSPVRKGNITFVNGKEYLISSPNVNKVMSKSDFENIIIDISKNKKDKPFEKKGVLREAKAPTGKEKALYLSQVGGSSNREIIRRIVYGTIVLGAYGVASGVSGVFNTIKHPVAYAKSMFEAIKNPKQTIKTEVGRFEVDPVGVVAEYIIFAKTLDMVGKGVKRSPIGRYVTEEVFIRSQPKKAQPYIRAIIKSAKVQEKLNPYNIKSIKKVDFAIVKNLNKIEAKALSKALKNTDSVIFGSLSGRTLSKGKTSIPKDVDLATANVTIFNKEFMKALPKNYRKAYIIRGEKILRKDGTPILDVKPLSRLVPSRNFFTGKGHLPVVGYLKKLSYNVEGQIKIPKIEKKFSSGLLEFPTQKILKIGDIKLVGFGEQTVRKALGTLQVLLEKNKRRAKDPSSFIKSLEVQLDSLKAKRPSLINKNRIKVISNALKLLKSKEFIKILEKKVPGLTKEYPLLEKINIKKLKKAVKESLIRKKQETKSIKEEVNYFKESKITESVLPKSSKLVSVLPKSSKLVHSKIPKSKIPKSVLKPSKVPTSKISNIFSSKIRSKLIESKIPKSVLKPSKVLPSNLIFSVLKPSKLVSSKIPKSKIPKSVLKPTKVLPSNLIKNNMKYVKNYNTDKEEQEKKKKIKKIFNIKDRKYLYNPDLYSIIFDIKSTRSERARLLKAGRVFGVETRPIV